MNEIKNKFYNPRIGFVILHYCTIKETINCVNSIINNIDTANYKIVIVDNYSPNGTGDELKKKYEGSETTEVLISKTNSGFAKGNNLGYEYAKNILKCDFICVMNNDTLLISKNFFGEIKKEFLHSQSGIMGPRIYLKNNEESFIYFTIPSKFELEQELKRNNLLLLETNSKIGFFWKGIRFCDKVSIKILRLLGVRANIIIHQKKEGYDERHENIILHGCCVIFSPIYIKTFGDAFSNETFMFREEELLYLRCQKNNIKIVYNPAISILHLEDAATDFILDSDLKKKKFMFENQIRSLSILLSKLEE